jgi:hypothetical protein
MANLKRRDKQKSHTTRTGRTGRTNKFGNEFNKMPDRKPTPKTEAPRTPQSDHDRETHAEGGDDGGR